jgi:hypothetical protein
VSPAGLCSTLVPLFGGEQQSPMGRTAESHGAKDKLGKLRAWKIRQPSPSFGIWLGWPHISGQSTGSCTG